MNDRSQGQDAGLTLRQDGAGGRELVRSADTGQTALAAAADAEVKARFVMARANPRAEENARIQILRSCKRPIFATAAMYCRPVGDGKPAEGLTIRFAEEARRNWGNIHTSAKTIYDDYLKRIVRVSSTDLETNITEELDMVIDKTVERRSLKEGQKAIGERRNSQGALVFLIEADEGAFLTKQKAAEAKARRQTILALIPADILEEARAMVKSTMRQEDAADPDAARKRLFDSFAEIGVMPDEIEERYLGHSIDQVTPAEAEELRGVYGAIRDGECTWVEACAAKMGDTGEAKNPAVSKAKEKINARVEAAKLRRKGAGAPAGVTPAPRAALAASDPVTPPIPPAPSTTPAAPRGREPGDD